MTRFQWHGNLLLSISNFLISAVFNKLLVRIDYYRDDKTDVLLETEWKLINRLKWKDEV